MPYSFELSAYVSGSSNRVHCCLWSSRVLSCSHSHRTAIYINITTTLSCTCTCIIVHTIIQTSWKLVSLVLHTLVDISSGVAIHCRQPLCAVNPSLNPQRALDARLFPNFLINLFSTTITNWMLLKCDRYIDSLQLLFYYDDVEICNPLGSKPSTN